MGSPRFKLVCTLIGAVLFASVGIAQEAEEIQTKVPTLTELEYEEDMKALDEDLERLQKDAQFITEFIERRKHQCMRAIGHDVLCQCLADNVSMMIPGFPEYVVILSQTKDELEYETLDQETRELIDKVHKVRDNCVSKAFSK